MMANHGGRSGNTNRSSSTPVKWTLVEAEPETPEGRRGKQQGYGRSRGHGASGSGSVGSWRSTRDGGRGRGGGQGFSNGNRGNRRGGGGSRTNQGQGRGRGYGRDSQSYVGATYYSSPSNFFGNESGQSLEEQKAYMTNMVVRQIEFYFTVENLCRDIFMRSYMDEEGYIPIAFVANFPGVARFGVELQDISAGILASDMLQVDTENETMRMREGWKVWLLPNQATGKQGVPRYIKVDPSVVPAEPAAGADSTDCDSVPDQAAQRTEPSTSISPEGKDEVGGAQLVSKTAAEMSPGAALPGKEKMTGVDGEVPAEATVEEAEARPGSEVEEVVDGKTELTPTAPAWTPGGVSGAKDATKQTSAPESSPRFAPPGDDTAETSTSGATESAGDGAEKKADAANSGLGS